MCIKTDAEEYRALLIDGYANILKEDPDSPENQKEIEYNVNDFIEWKNDCLNFNYEEAVKEEPYGIVEHPSMRGPLGLPTRPWQIELLMARMKSILEQ